MIFRRSLLLTIWICWSGFLLAQTPAPRIHWDWRKVEEATWKDNIVESKTLSAKEREGLLDAVIAQLRPSMSKVGLDSKEELREAATQTRVRAVDLSGSWRQGVCGTKRRRCFL